MDMNESDRDLLILCNLALVGPVAARLRQKLPPTFELADLIQEGMRGLIHAADTAAKAKTSFSLYAQQCIKGAILDSLGRSQATAEAENRYGRPPKITAYQLAVASRPLSDAADTPAAPRTDALEHLTARQRRLVEAVLAWSDSQDMADSAAAALSTLTHTERLLLRLMEVEGYTVAEIADGNLIEIGGRRDCKARARRVQRMHRKAVAKLREALKAA